MTNSDVVLKGMIENPKRSIIHMFLMISLTFIAIKVNGFLDIYWIANLSEEAVSAVSLVTPIYSIVAALGIGVGTGACVCIAYRLGRKDYSSANEMAGTAVYLGFVVAIPAILFLIFGTDLIFPGVDEEEIKGLTMDYVIPLAIGSPALIMTGILLNFLKATGAIRAMTICSLISIPVNAVLTPIFVYVIGWGIAGASAATVLGSVASVIVALVMLKSGRYHINPKFGRPSKAHIREVLGVGGPKALEEFLGGLTILVQNIILLTKLGGDAVAVHGITFATIYLFTILSDSVGAATLPVCSAVAGARRIESMKSSMVFSTLLLVGLSAIVLIALELFTPQVVQIFTNSDTIRIEEDLITALKVYSLMMPLYLLSRLASPLLQVLRKAHVWAPVFLVLSNLQVVLLYLYATDIQSMITIVAFSTGLLGVVGYIMAYHYARTYDPDVIDTMIKKGKGVAFNIHADEMDI